MNAASSTLSHRLPFEITELRSLPPERARATLRRFRWLEEFLLHSPGTATPEEARLLFQSIRVLEEMVNQ